MTNFRKFDLNLLLVLDGVLRVGTLSNAAKALNVSQPTISSSLAKLREILQDELFVRSGNGMQPTPRALALKGPVQRVLAAVKREILDTGRFDPATEKFQSWPIPSGGGVVRHMVTAPDGTLWLACSGVDRIARVEVKGH